MAFEATKSATVFTFLTPEIAEGKHIKPDRHMVDHAMPSTDDLTTIVKVYQSGGENRMHHHDTEDHAFFVLSGQATFRIESDDNTAEVGANDAILLPRGTSYCFQSTGEGNLVMLRVGSSRTGIFNRVETTGGATPDWSAKFVRIEGRALN